MVFRVIGCSFVPALPSMEFLPICIEVLGPMDPNTLKFLKEIGKRISVRSASIPFLKEPSGILVQHGKRPDGCTHTPWRAGKCLAWDVTVPGTLAERYVHLSSKECGLAAIRASDEKIEKYEHALPSIDFLPICIEVLGPMDPNTSKFIKTLCKMIGVRSASSIIVLRIRLKSSRLILLIEVQTGSFNGSVCLLLCNYVECCNNLKSKTIFIPSQIRVHCWWAALPKPSKSFPSGHSPDEMTDIAIEQFCKTCASLMKQRNDLSGTICTYMRDEDSLNDPSSLLNCNS
ncbi:hypothetical protein HELRODRAFT_181972 [Helobdella robusta]|uniref:Uncharacterized protein n=1 Tax=Helobdella robusta TaxID=6412 RepID=T1FHJ7_HELRO|nr:hypothetical protein HELRODRAFT_181972 [Helobdella robusta]ESN91917.1 hypothetical protein HELRODRAFT_181972 [Helobdella robusta]